MSLSNEPLISLIKKNKIKKNKEKVYHMTVCVYIEEKQTDIIMSSGPVFYLFI